jgi:SulP family sulfate permease
VHNLPASDVVTAVRFDGRLYFANVAYFEDAILEAVAEQSEGALLLVVGNGINELDASGEEVMHHIVERAARRNGVDGVFSGLKKQVVDVMRPPACYDYDRRGPAFTPRPKWRWRRSIRAKSSAMPRMP